MRATQRLTISLDELIINLGMPLLTFPLSDLFMMRKIISVLLLNTLMRSQYTKNFLNKRDNPQFIVLKRRYN